MPWNYEQFLEKSISDLSFEDVFDVEELQELQDAFANSLQIASMITDLDGTPITRPSNFCNFCKKYVRTTEEGLRRCMYSDSVIGNSKTNGFTVSRCLSAGLVDAGVPITVGDKHVANWVFGQARDEFDVLNEMEIRERAEEIGADVDGFINAYNKVPVVTRERFEYIAQLAYMVSKKLSEQAYQICVQKADEKFREFLTKEMTRQKEDIEYKNSIDALTGLSNRNYFEKQIEKLDRLGTTPVAVIVGDVNHLKVTNDVFGHRNGDWLLKTVAEVMLEEAFDGYMIFRCGGDEFNVIIPNGSRGDAEWFCHRVKHELKKRIGCCVLPSVAFGVAKKSHKQERLKDVFDIADAKMYRDKIQLKDNQHMVANIQQVLLGRGYLNSEYQNDSIGMARRYCEYLGEFDEWFIKRFTRLVRVQDYGVVMLPDTLFARRYTDELKMEERREVMKHPMVGHKIAKLFREYEFVADDVLAHEEHWDGTGYPRGISREDIPIMARLSKLVGDYSIFVAKAPIGMGKTKTEAYKMIEEGLGTKYDPNYGKKFLLFLEQDELSGTMD